MAKTLEEAYRQVVEASVLPNPANLKKPGIGAGSGQHSVGNMSVQTKSLAQAAADTGSYSAQSALNAPKLDTSKKVDTSSIQTPRVDTAVAQKAAADKAAAVSRATNTKVGPAAGGNYQSAQAKRIFPKTGNGPMGTQLGIANRNAPTADAAKQNIRAGITKTNNAEIARAQRQAAANKAQAGRVGTNTTQANVTANANKPEAPPKPTPRPQQTTGNPNVRTSGTPAVPGNANIKPSAKLDFKQAYAAARKTGQTNFEWNGKKYNTNMKGETSAKRNQVLARNKQRTAGKAARSGSLMEMIKNICREKAQPLLEYQARSKPTGGYIGAKVPNARMSMHDKMSLPLSGKDVSKRYTLSTVVEAEKEIDDANLEKKKKRSKETLNTEPQQSDEKIF